MPSTPELDMGNLLLDCLQQYYVTSHENLPDIPTSNFCLIPGTEIAEDVDPMTSVDLCCNGLAWVRIADAWPSSVDFPAPDQLTTKCFSVAWAQRYEVGILGCYNSSEALSCAQKHNYALEDAARIRAIKEVFCCFGNALNDNPRTRGRLWTIEAITVQGPRGGCISRVASIVVQLPKCC